MKIPNSKLVTVKRLLPYFANDDQVKKYLPCNAAQSGGNNPEKQWFFGLIGSLAKERLDAWLKEFYQTKYGVT